MSEPPTRKSRFFDQSIRSSSVSPESSNNNDLQNLQTNNNENPAQHQDSSNEVTQPKEETKENDRIENPTHNFPNTNSKLSLFARRMKGDLTVAVNHKAGFAPLRASSEPHANNNNTSLFTLGDSSNNVQATPAFPKDSKIRRGSTDTVQNMLQRNNSIGKLLRKANTQARAGHANFNPGSIHESEYEEIQEIDTPPPIPEETDPAKIALIKKFKRASYVIYFIGIMFTLKNRVKVMGAIRPVDHLKEFEKEKNVEIRTACLPLLPSSPFIMVWTLILTILIVATAILTPYRVSFVEDGSGPFDTIDIVFNIGFGIDMVINFISAYHDEKRGLVTDFRSIILTYLKGWFWIDLIAIIPFDTILSDITDYRISIGKYSQLVRLLRFPRLYRLLKVLRLFKMMKLFASNHSLHKMTKKFNINMGLIKMVKVILNVVFLNHIVGCLWFFTARLDNFGDRCWVTRYGIRDADEVDQYIASFYWAFQTVTTVGYGDIPPETTLEKIVCVSWMMAGVLFYSFTIGNLSTILANIDRRSQLLKNKISAFNNFAIKVKLPEFMRQKVQRFFELNHKENVYYWMDPTEMLKELPANLRTSLLLYSYYAMIKNIRLLQIDANFTAALVTHIKVLKLKEKEILYREDDPAEEIFFISKGGVKLINDQEQGIYSMIEGTYFGEIEILENKKRFCFCQASEPTILLVVAKEAFLEVLKDFPPILNQIKKTAEMRKEKFQRKLAQINKDQDENGGQTPAKTRKLLKSTEYLKDVILKDIVKEKKKPKLVKPPTIQHSASILKMPTRSLSTIKENVKQEAAPPEIPPNKPSGGGGGLLEMLRKGGLIGKKKEEDMDHVQQDQGQGESENSKKLNEQSKPNSILSKFINRKENNFTFGSQQSLDSRNDGSPFIKEGRESKDLSLLGSPDKQENSSPETKLTSPKVPLGNLANLLQSSKVKEKKGSILPPIINPKIPARTAALSILNKQPESGHMSDSSDIKRDMNSLAEEKTPPGDEKTPPGCEDTINLGSPEKIIKQPDFTSDADSYIHELRMSLTPQKSAKDHESTVEKLRNKPTPEFDNFLNFDK